MCSDQKSKPGQNELPLTEDSQFAVALSGGGHRATLYAIGGLMALVDAGANSRTEQIASVSGGSITNAVVAEACEFQTIKPSEFDSIVKDLFETVTQGVITKPIIGIFVAMVFGPAVIFVILGTVGWLPQPLITVSLVTLWLSIILFRGILIELLMDRRYMQVPRRLLGSLRSQSVSKQAGTDHVFCCTELVSGKPMYFSTMQGGVACSAFGENTWKINEDKNIHDAHNVRLFAVLRASAGFPGIPPRRFRLFKKSWISSILPLWPFGSIAFLSDGGVWNNLGTNALLEDNFYKDNLESGIRSSDYPKILLSLDASADLDRISFWDLHVPGWSEVKALVRQAVISNANTVEPRRKTLEKSFCKMVTCGGIYDPFVGIEKIVDHTVGEKIASVIPLSRAPCDVAEHLHIWLYLYFLKLGFDITEFGQLDPELWKQLQSGPVEAERVWKVLRDLPSRRHVWKRGLELILSNAFEDLCMIGGQPEKYYLSIFKDDLFSTLWPLGRPDSGESELKNIIMTLIEGVSAELRMRKPKDSIVNKVPTTLGAIDRATARQILGRGYANTAITLFLLGLTDTLHSPRQYHPWVFEE